MGLYFVLVAGSCVVDEDIHTPKFGERVLHQSFPVTLVGYIGFDEVHNVRLEARYPFAADRAVLCEYAGMKACTDLNDVTMKS